MAAVSAPYDLAGPEHDVDAGEGPPARSYVLCSMPRSGSSLLSEAFHATGRMGTPIEYLDRTNAFAVLAYRWGTPDLAAYIRALHRYRTTPEGLFGVKLHWFHLAELAAGLTATGVIDGSGGTQRCRQAALEALAPNPRVVLLTRRDVDRQAVSWFVADRTGRWSSVDRRGTDERPPYDRRAIERRRRLALAGTRAWADFLARSGVDVLEVAYEDLVADHERTVRSAARHVGVELPGEPLAPPRLRRQADEHSEDLVVRFRADSRRT
jgi:trehalose 2-sulfotransferase